MRINLFGFFKLTLLVFLLSLVSCKREKKVVIEGQFSGIKNSYVYLASMNLMDTRIIDSTESDDDGRFKFKMHLKNPDFYQVFLSKNDFIILLPKPGEKIKLTAKGNDLNSSYIVNGSLGSAQVKYLTDNLRTTKNKLDSLSRIIDEAYGKPGFDTLYQRINNQYINVIKDQRNVSIKFIIENHHSLASIIALYQQLNDSTYVLNQNRDLQLVNIVADTLNRYYPEVSSVKILIDDRNRLKQNYNALKLGLLQLHSTAVSFPDISLNNISKELVSLKEIKSKNKCVLVNFWSSENEECIIVLKSLRELYPEFKSKGFEIYNIGLTDDQQNWEDFIKSGNIRGINVIDKTANSANLYNVKSLPASYLIGPDGSIAAKDVFGENLRSLLKQLLK